MTCLPATAFAFHSFVCLFVCWLHCRHCDTPQSFVASNLTDKTKLNTLCCARCVITGQHKWKRCHTAAIMLMLVNAMIPLPTFLRVGLTDEAAALGSRFFNAESVAENNKWN